MPSLTERDPRSASFSTEEWLKVFSVLTHDLKSPLFSVDGFSDLLLSDYEDKLDEEGVDFLRRIRSSASSMKKVIEEMSHVVRLLTRPNAVRTMDLNEVLEEVRLRFGSLLSESGTELELKGSFPTIKSDPEKLREAVAALVHNGIVFNEREPGQRKVTVSYEKAGPDHRLCVEDNGVGVDKRYLEQIFELGLQLDKNRAQGPGYGLFLARRIAESLGGGVSAESKPGEGSRFCLSVPETGSS